MTCFVCGKDTSSSPCVGPCREFCAHYVHPELALKRRSRPRRPRLQRRQYRYSLEVNKPALRARSGGICEGCGKRSVLHVHRIIPGRFCGQYVSHNVRILCPACHKQEEQFPRVSRSVWDDVLRMVYPDMPEMISDAETADAAA